MVTFLLVVLAVIVTALVVSNLPMLRARMAARRSPAADRAGGGIAAPQPHDTGPRPRRAPWAGVTPRIEPIQPAPEPVVGGHVPDAEELQLRAQAHREAAALHQRQAAQIDHGVVPVPPATNGFTPEPAPEDYEYDPYDGRRR